MRKNMPRSNKKIGCLFVNVFSGFSLSWNSLHRYHPPSWIFVIIHVENTFRAMNGEMCGKIWKSESTFENSMNMIPSQRYENFRYILESQKVYLLGSCPSSPTYTVKNLRVTALLFSICATFSTCRDIQCVQNEGFFILFSGYSIVKVLECLELRTKTPEKLGLTPPPTILL